jgi:hypothetical protein
METVALQTIVLSDALLVLAVCSVGACVGGMIFMRRSTYRPWFYFVFSGIAAGTVWYVAAHLTAHRSLDMNPAIEDARRLEGQWVGDQATLELRPDFTYGCHGARCANLGDGGRWERKGDFNVQLLSRSGAATTYRVVSYQGQLHVTDDSGDPDAWEGRLFFAQLTDSLSTSHR